MQEVIYVLTCKDEQGDRQPFAIRKNYESAQKVKKELEENEKWEIWYRKIGHIDIETLIWDESHE